MQSKGPVTKSEDSLNFLIKKKKKSHMFKTLHFTTNKKCTQNINLSLEKLVGPEQKLAQMKINGKRQVPSIKRNNKSKTEGDNQY